MQPIFISVSEFCDLFNIGKTKAYQLIGQGVVSSTKFGRKRMIQRQSAVDLANRLIASSNEYRVGEAVTAWPKLRNVGEDGVSSKKYS